MVSGHAGRNGGLPVGCAQIGSGPFRSIDFPDGLNFVRKADVLLAERFDA